MAKAKPFCITKREVWEAYKRVKANQGAAGVDGQTIAEFEKNLSGHLYKLWNRLSSGSYMPAPVRRVDIPKGDGKTRPLGIPTVADRIAQMVVKRRLEPHLEPEFHNDSYGYRPNRTAHDALARARQRCWQHDWVVDLDIKGFFDNLDWDLLMKALRRHTQSACELLYIERWLRAPVRQPDGTQTQRDKGTPQGGVISPLLANLYLHYAFDRWMSKHHPDIPFERYADDVICHCASEAQAQRLRAELETRFEDCKLQLHPEKTKIAYCKDANRQGSYPVTQFDFLGYTFRPREAKNRHGKLFSSFSPAVSNKAAKAMRETVRGWRLGRRSDLSLGDLIAWIRPILTGWVRYYGRFHGSAVRQALRTVDDHLLRWAQRKYKRYKRHATKAWKWLADLKRRAPTLFPHWSLDLMVGR